LVSLGSGREEQASAEARFSIDERRFAVQEQRHVHVLKD